MLLIYCKIKLNLTWKKECVLSNQDGAAVFNYFNKHYKLVAADLSKQKELDADQI